MVEKWLKIRVVKKLEKNTKESEKAPHRVRSPVRAVVRHSVVMNEVLHEEIRSFSFLSKILAIVLFVFFIFQPIGVLYAAEDTAASEASVPHTDIAKELTTTEVVPVVVDDGPEEGQSRDTVQTDMPAQIVATSTTSQGDRPVDERTTEGVDVKSPPSSSEVSASTTGVQSLERASTSVAQETMEVTTVTGVSTSTVAVGAEVSSADEARVEAGSAPEDEVLVSEEGVMNEEVATNTDPGSIAVEPAHADSLTEKGNELSVAEVSDEVASSTESTVVQPEAGTQLNDENRYQFGVKECVTVANGFFYCSKNAVPKMTLEDSVYEAQDAEGDYEIFISKDGVETQITHNSYDDSAPYYDSKSNRLVWHAFIDDRYQIMMYDFTTNTMQQFTHENFNSMQPVALGDRIVWQAWTDNNWEIVMDENGVRTQLTHNDTQDIAPHIRGNLVSWQSQNGTSRDITIYNLDTKETEVVAGAGGNSATNPRFLLVYDSLKENGDVATLGYDPDTKQVRPLAAIPHSVPREIPEPEHSREKGAFVQTPPSVKNEGDKDSDAGAAPPNIVPDVVDAAAAVSQGDIVVLATSTPRASSTVSENTLRNDIDMTVAIVEKALPQDTIPDVVIVTRVSSTTTHDIVTE